MALTFNEPKIQEFMKEKLGSPIDKVFHAPVPFQFGYDAGGAADVYLYKRHDGYISYVTGDLIGKKQKPSDAGNYELLLVMEEENNNWGANLISLMAFSTINSSLNSGETMGIGNFSKDAGLDGVIFDNYGTTLVGNKTIGIMLVVGITKEELEWKFKNGGKNLLQKLKDRGVYPRTVLNRKSITFC